MIAPVRVCYTCGVQTSRASGAYVLCNPCERRYAPKVAAPPEPTPEPSVRASDSFGEWAALCDHYGNPVFTDQVTGDEVCRDCYGGAP